MDNERNPLVSIIINNYNYGRFLADAIDSALNQEYPLVEVIVVDDGSTDISREVIESYGNSILAIYKQNGGQATCFNAGFERCLGDIVMFLDSDDFLFPTAVSSVVERMRDPSVSKCNGYLQAVDRDGKPTGQKVPRKLSPSGRYKEAVLKYGPWTYSSCYTSGNAWSRSFLSQVMPIPTDNRVKGGADGYLTAIDALYGNIELIDEFIGGYRIHGANFLTSFRRFTSENLASVLQSEQERGRYLAKHAEDLGYAVDQAAWVRRSSWMMLIRFSLSLTDQSIEAPRLLDHLASPFLKENRTLLSRLKQFCSILIIRFAPKALSIELSRRNLQYLKS